MITGNAAWSGAEERVGTILDTDVNKEDGVIAEVIIDGAAIVAGCSVCVNRGNTLARVSVRTLDVADAAKVGSAATVEEDAEGKTGSCVSSSLSRIFSVASQQFEGLVQQSTTRLPV